MAQKLERNPSYALLPGCFSHAGNASVCTHDKGTAVKICT